ncbi:hypothetical protein AERO8C_50168 [Aeromonas veronii]|uniref:Uncharacterized protein n=1 Tax=Aeromonas veronii TaxID=654 RepID=A0A653L8M4_AERVE|nr:hypothetical protein AERO8C_50168 [Aeromonas veronii]
MVIAMDAPAQHKGILGADGDDHGQTDGEALQCRCEHHGEHRSK